MRRAGGWQACQVHLPQTRDVFAQHIPPETDFRLGAVEKNMADLRMLCEKQFEIIDAP